MTGVNDPSAISCIVQDDGLANATKLSTFIKYC